MDIAVTHDVRTHRFSAVVDQHACELDYSVRDGVMSILHTEVPPEAGGRGIAGQLTLAALEYAKTQGWKIRPICSYAVGYFRRHPEYAELLA
jgi:predicted GNAT family acetyltransferase